jgi:hypothetical protein
MIAIGFRAQTSEVFYAVVSEEGDARFMRTVGSINIPVAFTTPERLQFIRTTLLDIIGEFGVDAAGLRTAEPTARSVPVGRAYIEGVIQELIASGAVPRHFAGAIGRLHGLLPVEKRTDVKDLIDGKQEPSGIPNWDSYSALEREAILTALAALNLKSPLAGILDGQMPSGTDDAGTPPLS